MDKQIASLKAEQKGVKSPEPAPVPPAETKSPAPAAPALHAKPHG